LSQQSGESAVVRLAGVHARVVIEPGDPHLQISAEASLAAIAFTASNS